MAYDPIPRVNAAGVAVWSAKVAGDSNNRNQITADGQMSWGPGSGAVDTFMSRSAAAVVAFGEVDGAASHTVRVYGTRSASGANYERLGLNAGSSVFDVVTEAAGTGTAQVLRLGTGSVSWSFDSSNHLVALSDNLRDIGVLGSTRPRSIYWGTQALGPDGTETNPTYSFGSNSNTGIFLGSSGVIRMTAGGSEFVSFFSSGIRMISGLAFGWSNSATNPSGTSDLTLHRDAAFTLAQYNGVNAQAYRIYNTTDGVHTNYERLAVEWVGNSARVLVELGGTGVARSLTIGTDVNESLFLRSNGTSRWRIPPAGHIWANSDNVYDFGVNGSSRARFIYWGTQALAPNGSESAPFLALAGETNTGLYGGTGALRVTVAGDQTAAWTGSTYLIYDATFQLVDNAGANGVTFTRANSSLTLSQAIATTGSPTLMTFTAAAHTTLTLSVEAPTVTFDASATKQWATGAIAAQREFKFLAPTYGFVGASVISDAATVYISGAPILGAFATFTRSFAFWVNAGISRFDGNVEPGSNNAVDLGTSALTWRSGYFGTSITLGTNPSTAGTIRLPNTGTIEGRNVGDSGNLQMMTLTSGNIIGIGTGNNTPVTLGTGAFTIGGALNHDGSTAGFFSVTPASQPAHIADPTGGSVIDIECRAQLVLLLADQATLGLQAAV